MAIVNNYKILLKRGITDPSTTLDLGEPGFDTSGNILYIGKGIGEIPVKFYPNVSTGGSTCDVTKAYVDGSIANFITNASALTLINDVSLWKISDYNGDVVLTPVGTYNLYLPGDDLATLYASKIVATNMSTTLTVTDALQVIPSFDPSIVMSLADNYMSLSYDTLQGGMFLDYTTPGSYGLYLYDTYVGNIALNSIATNASVNLAFLTNPSLGSLGDLGPYATNASVNDAFITNVSLGILSFKSTIDNVSIGLINASLNDIILLISYVNTSSYYDASLVNIRANYIPNVSLNTTYFKWINGYLEPSASGDVTKAYVDGSIANFATNASVNTAFITNVSLGRLSSSSVVYNVSIGMINASINDTTPLTSYVNSSSYYDGSLAIKWDSFPVNYDLSVNNLTVINNFIKIGDYDTFPGDWDASIAGGIIFPSTSGDNIELGIDGNGYLKVGYRYEATEDPVPTSYVALIHGDIQNLNNVEDTIPYFATGLANQAPGLTPITIGTGLDFIAPTLSVLDYVSKEYVDGSVNNISTTYLKKSIPYISLYDTSTKTAGLSVPRAILWNQEAAGNKIIHKTGDSSWGYTVAGDYLMIFSAIGMSKSPGDHMMFWWTKNGSTNPIPYSNTKVEFVTNNNEKVITVSFIADASVGDYHELMWYASDPADTLVSVDASTLPFVYPASPSIILTINLINEY